MEKRLRLPAALLATLWLIGATGCGSREQVPQNAQEAKAKFMAHPSSEELTPQARAIVEAMKKRGTTPVPSPARQ